MHRLAPGAAVSSSTQQHQKPSQDERQHEKEIIKEENKKWLTIR
jgi:hypothetical protein